MSGVEPESPGSTAEHSAIELHQHGAFAPPRGFEPQSSHSKCDILPLDEGGMPSYAMVPPAGFEPASPRLKGEHPGPLDEGRIGAGSEDRTHTSWLEAKHAPQYAIPALILAES